MPLTILQRLGIPGFAAQQTRTPNTPRFDGSAKSGHVESYFLRANHPSEPRAVWLKTTILASKNGTRTSADAWCIVFDGAQHRSWAGRTTVPFSEARFASSSRGGADVSLAGCAFQFDTAGSASGALTGQDGACGFELSWRPGPESLAEPLSLYPLDSMVDGSFPRSKLLTPHPCQRFDGRLDVFGETWELDGWYGMQGHNWGAEHAWEYAWGQCLFDDAGGTPHALVEGFSGRIRLAGLVTPRLSAMVVRRGGKTYRFDHIFDFWRQDATISDMSWNLRLRGSGGEAALSMVADPRQMVCLGYENPDGRLSYCMNSKLARVHLRVNPIDADGFECTSAHGGALEFLRNQPDARFDRIV